ncbi:MAG: menaquinone biosynthetic enzyme MqnA/MqnD family protein [Eubacteriales bacterium]
MTALRLGQVDYFDCLPVYHAFEEGLVPLHVELIKGSPAALNQMFLAGQLDATPISSIEYARNTIRCLILPGLSISASGRVGSILFFSRLPVTELEGRKVCLTDAGATSVAFLKVLFDHYYHVDVSFEICPPDLASMMKTGDGALLTGDYAIIARQKVKDEGLPYHVTDLGEAWRQFTGEKMVYAMWVVRHELAKKNPEKVAGLSQALIKSREIGLSALPALVAKTQKESGLPLSVLKDYFAGIHYDFDDSYRRALLLFYNYAYKSGLIEERVKLRVWGED